MGVHARVPLVVMRRREMTLRIVAVYSTSVTRLVGWRLEARQEEMMKQEAAREVRRSKRTEPRPIEIRLRWGEVKSRKNDDVS